MIKKIAIQGYNGSFHQIAARQFFGNQIQIIPCTTFREVGMLHATSLLALHDKETHAGVMAIENSIAGSILPNYNLLQKRKNALK